MLRRLAYVLTLLAGTHAAAMEIIRPQPIEWRCERRGCWWVPDQRRGPDSEEWSGPDDRPFYGPNTGLDPDIYYPEDMRRDQNRYWNYRYGHQHYGYRPY